jgi:hypothetical protein
MAVVIVVVTAVIFVVPVAFMHLPPLLVMIIVRMAPVSAGVWRAIPAARNPDIPSTLGTPIAVNPGITLAGHRRASLITHGWRGPADINTNLRKGGPCKSRCHDGTE